MSALILDHKGRLDGDSGVAGDAGSGGWQVDRRMKAGSIAKEGRSAYLAYQMCGATTA